MTTATLPLWLRDFVIRDGRLVCTGCDQPVETGGPVEGANLYDLTYMVGFHCHPTVRVTRQQDRPLAPNTTDPWGSQPTTKGSPS
jgi:hypothetical protein